MRRDYNWNPGYRESRNTGCEVTFYTTPDAVLDSGPNQSNLRGKPLPINGRRRFDDNPFLLSVSTSKRLGDASGTWSIDVAWEGNLQDALIDDDWVDIVFTRDGQRFHTMRGLVDYVTLRKSASRGVTTQVWQINGRDFGKVFETTPIYFDPYAEENAAGGAVRRVFTGTSFRSNDNLVEGGVGNPANAVEAFLFGFLGEFNNIGRSVFRIPAGMPGINSNQDRFVDNVFFSNLYADSPARAGIGFNYLNPQGSLWQLAQEWSDPMLNEVFADLYSADENIFSVEQDRERTPENSEMQVSIRERPFFNPDNFRDSTFFELPVFQIPRQAVRDLDISRNGGERYNTFFVTPAIHVEQIAAIGADLLRPKINASSVDRHGIRRFDVDTRYLPIDVPSEDYLNQIRDKVTAWYVGNAYFYSGTVSLVNDLPECKIGTKIRVNGPSQQETLTAYVEGIDHNWTLDEGVTTSLAITRGHYGTDQDLINLVENIYFRTTLAPRSTSAQAGTGFA